MSELTDTKIRAIAIGIAFRTFERIAEILLRDEVVKNCLIPEDQWKFADCIAEYIKTGKHPHVPMELIKSESEMPK